MKHLLLFLMFVSGSLYAQNIATQNPYEDVIYKKVGDVELKLKVFKSHKAQENAPCIVFFFGGGWVGGSPKQFYKQAEHFSKLGLVAVSVEYRIKKVHGTSPFECVKDGKSAIRFLRKNAEQYGIDPEKIIASGGSAGGHVAACTSLIEGVEEEGDDLEVSSVPNALILFNPVLDTTEKGCGANKFKEDKTVLSPCHHVRKGLSPTLVMTGTADKVTPFENAERFTRLMKESGNDSRLIAFEGQGHGFFNPTSMRPKNDPAVYAKTLRDSEAFLRELKLFP